MHTKKYLYIKGIHIKLIFKNNLLRCYVYNYSDTDKYIVCEKDSVLSKDKKITENEKMVVMRKQPFVMTQEITWDELVSSSFKLAFDLFDKNKHHLIYDEYKKPFTDVVNVKFNR